MGISRPTFSRVLAEARTAVAKALTNGWAIRIEGGHYTIVSSDKRCCRWETKSQEQNKTSEHEGDGICQE